MLYTGRGDDGTTKAFDSKCRFSKNTALAEALGTLDELNSLLAISKTGSRKAEQQVTVLVDGNQHALDEVLKAIQEHLFIAQAELGGAGQTLSGEQVQYLEQVIASVEETIPPLTAFSVPGGAVLSAQLDHARAVARRMERRVLAVHEAGDRAVSTHTLAYINRLSSVLFALARLTNHVYGIKEEPPKY